MTIHFLAGLTDPDAGATSARCGGAGPAAAAAQAEAVFDRLDQVLAARGCIRTDTCKLTLRITARAYREGVYAVLGRRLAGVFPVSTGLIVDRLDDPEALVQLDVHAVPGGPHERLRRYRSSDGAYGLHKQAFSMDFCMVVVAGRHVFLRGQTGSTLDRRFPHLGDADAQVRLAVANIAELLADAGATPAHTTHLITYATAPALFAPLRAVVGPAFAAAPVAATEVLVAGLAAPELLIEIDVLATLPDTTPA